MNRNKAKRIAEIVTIKQLREMFNNAKSQTGSDWDKVSSVNKGLTKGAAWNILYNPFCAMEFKGELGNGLGSQLGIKNMIWEFGDYLDKELLEKFSTKKKVNNVTPYHEEPDIDISDLF